jgi:biopolymer transport protein ExbD
MRVRRLHKQAAHLELTAFINLIVVLVPFLLSTAVFSRLAVLELTLPAQASGALQQLATDNLQLEVVVRPDALEVGDRIGGLIQRIPDVNGAHDYKALSGLIVQVKQKFPDKTTATVLAEQDTPYDVLVQTMDAMRTGKVIGEGNKVIVADLFPEISIGDAPVRKR